MTTRDKINSLAECCDSEILLLEPAYFDDAIIGIAERANGMTVVAYDRNRCIDQVMVYNECDREDAEEFFEFNTAQTWIGEGTPVFIDTRYAE